MIRAFATRDAAMQAAAERIAEAFRTGISERGQAFAALSGGTTPAAAYEALAVMPLDWARVTFLVVDERFVPLSDEASNEALLRRALAPALAAGASVLPLYSDNVSIDEAAARANALYADKPIDIALVGMGGDGHTASWFPRASVLEAALTDARSVIAINAPGAYGTPERLTLTRAGMAQAEAIILLITGAEKRALLEDRARARLPVDELFDLPAPIETIWAP